MFSPLSSEVVEDLAPLAPVHARSSSPAAAADGLLLGLGRGGTQTQAVVHEGVRHASLVLVSNLEHETTLFQSLPTCDWIPVLASRLLPSNKLL